MPNPYCTIYLMRHGETDWNKSKRIQGHTDVALNTNGQAQVLLLAHALAHVNFSAIYSSDLTRACQTAAPIAQSLQLPLICRKNLRERFFANFEGLSLSDFEQQYPEDFVAWKSRSIEHLFILNNQAAETLRQFTARAEYALTCIAQAHLGQTIAIVTHGGILDAFYRMVTKQPLSSPRTFALANASINQVQYWADKTPYWKINQWCDITHLGQSLDEVDSQLK